jgi:hypothetical protein
MRRFFVPLAVSVLAVSGLSASPAVDAAVSVGSIRASCAVSWGSLEKVDPDMSGAHLVNIRAGRHACFDRLVFDLDGRPGGFAVRYVSQMTGLASGEPIALRGGAFLEVIVRVPAHDFNGRSTYPRAGRSELVDVSEFCTFRQAAWAESHEGLTAIGLGVRARLPFRVFVLDGPGAGSRVVVDVAHRW